jgi:hypothetical protein
MTQDNFFRALQLKPLDPKQKAEKALVEEALRERHQQRMAIKQLFPKGRRDTRMAYAEALSKKREFKQDFKKMKEVLASDTINAFKPDKRFLKTKNTLDYKGKEADWM